jgi:diguanylate cyclase (GGDEF)-like protein/PAS domain S-box-containing protein
MGTPLRALIIADSHEEALALVRELEQGGFEPLHERVETAAAIRSALRKEPWDIILCSDRIKDLDCLEALALVKESRIDTPFVIVSRTISEEMALDAMKAGARDCIKNRRERIAPIVEGELRAAALRLERRQAEEELHRNREDAERLAEEMAIIAEIGRLIGSTLNIEEVYERFADEAKKLIPFDRIAVNLNGYQESKRYCAYASGVDIPGRRPGDSFPLARSVNELLVGKRSGVIIHPKNIAELKSQYPSLVSTFRAGLRSMMSVPLISRDEVIGALHFRAKNPNAYTERDLRLAERIGEQISGAIANARLFAELRKTERSLREAEEEQRRNREKAERLADEMAVIAEIGRVIGSTPNIEEVYERFAAETRKLIPFDSLMVNLVRPEENELLIAYTAGMDIPARRTGDRVPLKGSVCEVVTCGRGGLLLQSESAEEIVRKFPSLIHVFDAGLRSMMFVPLISADKVIGALVFRSEKQDAYTTDNLNLAERIGTQIAGAVANAQLFIGLKKTETLLRESEARFRAIFEQAAVGVSEFDIATGRFLAVNRRLCELVGMTEEELLASTFHAITHPDDRQLHRDEVALLEAGKIRNLSLEKRYIRKDGEIIWVSVTVSPLRKTGGMSERNLAVIQDISERMRIRQQNERHAKQLTDLHETSIELTSELNLNTLLQSIAMRALNLIGGTYCNCYLYRTETDLLDRVANAGKELFPSGGTTRQRGEGLVGQVWEQGVPLLVDDYRSWPGRNKRYDAYPSRAMVGAPIHWGEEFLGVLSVSAFLPHRYTQADSDVLGMFATQAAIAIRNARLYGTIEQLAVKDELTDLLNRRGFFQLGEREFEGSLRFNRPLAALMFDIDHFKRVNDIHGHPAGDQVLRLLADCFRQNTRGIDVTGRYGGEEFVLLMPETLLPGAVQIAERLRQSIADLSVPIRPANGDPSTIDIHVTVSIGVAVLLPDVSSLAVLLERTDQALYRAKNSGRNRVVVWEKSAPCMP